MDLNPEALHEISRLQEDILLALRTELKKLHVPEVRGASIASIPVDHESQNSTPDDSIDATSAGSPVVIVEPKRVYSPLINHIVPSKPKSHFGQRVLEPRRQNDAGTDKLGRRPRLAFKNRNYPRPWAEAPPRKRTISDESLEVHVTSSHFTCLSTMTISIESCGDEDEKASNEDDQSVLESNGLAAYDMSDNYNELSWAVPLMVEVPEMRTLKSLGQKPPDACAHLSYPEDQTRACFAFSEKAVVFPLVREKVDLDSNVSLDEQKKLMSLLELYGVKDGSLSNEKSKATDVFTHLSSLKLPLPPKDPATVRSKKSRSPRPTSRSKSKQGQSESATSVGSFYQDLGRAVAAAVGHAVDNRPSSKKDIVLNKQTGSGVRKRDSKTSHLSTNQRMSKRSVTPKGGQSSVARDVSVKGSIYAKKLDQISSNGQRSGSMSHRVSVIRRNRCCQTPKRLLQMQKNPSYTKLKSTVLTSPIAKLWNHSISMTTSTSGLCNTTDGATSPQPFGTSGVTGNSEEFWKTISSPNGGANTPTTEVASAAGVYTDPMHLMKSYAVPPHGIWPIGLSPPPAGMTPVMNSWRDSVENSGNSQTHATVASSPGGASPLLLSLKPCNSSLNLSVSTNGDTSGAENHKPSRKSVSNKPCPFVGPVRRAFRRKDFKITYQTKRKPL